MEHRLELHILSTIHSDITHFTATGNRFTLKTSGLLPRSGPQSEKMRRWWVGFNAKAHSFCSCSPRPPLPLSATLTEDEAAMIIQSFYRAYRVRCWPDVAQLREWQRGFRKEVEAIIKIQRFWRSRKTNS